MKKSLNKDMLKLNLQMFADEPGAESDKTGTDAPEGTETETTVEFTDEQQGHIDRLIAQAKSKGKSESEKSLRKEFEANQQKAIEEALAKDKEYSKLSDEDREKKQFDDEKAIFEAEKAEFAYDKLINDISSDLLKEDMPTSFATFLAVKGDDKQSLANVQTFKGAWDTALSEAVKKELQHPNATAGGRSTTETNEGAALAKRTNKQRTTGKII